MKNYSNNKKNKDIKHTKNKNFLINISKLNVLLKISNFWLSIRLNWLINNIKNEEVL